MKYADLEKMIKNEKDGIKRTAEYIGVTEQKLMDKLKGRCPLFVSEVYMICALFNIQNPQEKQTEPRYKIMMEQFLIEGETT